MTERLPPMPEPLTPEERALAARLGRLGPHGEPSPALDARILAAARAELPASAARKRNANRLPLAFGIAASVSLAVGLAWQLRPLPEPVAYDEAASAAGVAASAPAAEAASADAMAAADPMPTMVKPAEPPPAGEEAPVAFQRSAAPARQAAAKPETTATRDVDAEPRRERAHPAPPAPPAPPPSPVVLQEPAPAAGIASEAAAAAADTALPPPPPAAPPTTATKPAPAKAAAPSPQALAREAAARDAAAAQRARNAAAASAAEKSRAAQVAEDSFADEPFVEDVPPATADSPAVRDAWLHRIRELQAGGDTEAARASLQEFVRRYPAFPLPDDLRLLLD